MAVGGVNVFFCSNPWISSNVKARNLRIVTTKIFEVPNNFTWVKISKWYTHMNLNLRIDLEVCFTRKETLFIMFYKERNSFCPLLQNLGTFTEVQGQHLPKYVFRSHDFVFKGQLKCPEHVFNIILMFWIVFHHLHVLKLCVNSSKLRIFTYKWSIIVKMVIFTNRSNNWLFIGKIPYFEWFTRSWRTCRWWNTVQSTNRIL